MGDGAAGSRLSVRGAWFLVVAASGAAWCLLIAVVLS